MNVVLEKAWRLHARIVNNSVLGYKQLQARWHSTRKMKILFSNKQDWKRPIENGFRFTHHDLAFADLSTAKLKDFDLVVPLTIEDVKYLNELPELIVDNPIPIPSMECTLLCDDKLLLNRALEANGLGHCVPRMGGALTYPYILKKRIDAYGANSHIIFSPQQEQTLAETLAHADYFSQEFIPGHLEYATHILFRDRRCICALNIKYAFDSDTPIKGKTRETCTRICRCPYLEEFSSILSTIGFNGLCCINYKERNNRPLILEINPRFGGSLCPFFFSFLRHIA
jgi:hypothetical protein